MNEFENIEQKVRRAIAMHRNDENFPNIEDYGGSEDLLDDYFYEKTATGSLEQDKKKYTLYGLFLIVPIAVFSIFFQDIKALIFGLLTGGLLCFGLRLLLRWKKARRERLFRDCHIEEFIQDVLAREK